MIISIAIQLLILGTPPTSSEPSADCPLAISGIENSQINKADQVRTPSYDNFKDWREITGKSFKKSQPEVAKAIFSVTGKGFSDDHDLKDLGATKIELVKVFRHPHFGSRYFAVVAFTYPGTPTEYYGKSFKFQPPFYWAGPDHEFAPYVRMTYNWTRKK